MAALFRKSVSVLFTSDCVLSAENNLRRRWMITETAGLRNQVLEVSYNCLLSFLQLYNVRSGQIGSPGTWDEQNLCLGY